MIKEKIGFVTENEKKEILELHERKLALVELLPGLPINNDSNEQFNLLYEKVVKDLGKTKVKIEEWWNSMAINYTWKSNKNGKWIIDFKSNEIFLVTE